MELPYVTTLTPPAPFLVVRLSPTTSGAATDVIPAQVDSGADRSVIPAAFVEQLGLSESGTIFVSGLGGEIAEGRIYDLWLTVANLSPLLIEVLAHSGEHCVLLGRDVLNRYRIILDGPNQRLEIV